MRYLLVICILALSSICFGEWVDAYTDSHGVYHRGYYRNDYSTSSRSSTSDDDSYKPKTYRSTYSSDDNDYKPKTEYVKPYVKKDGEFVNGYWRSKKDDD
jgi:hypothetical protein